jgi:hypothetical protein
VLDVSNLPRLEYFDCSNNQIAELDFGRSGLLEELLCQNNRLIYVNLKRGVTGEGERLSTVNAKGNLNPCVQVDDVAFAEAQWRSGFDPGATFSTDCSAQPKVVFIPDANFKRVLLSNDSINSNKDEEIQVAEAAIVETLNVPNKNISDLTGIGSFTSLKSLNCSDNNLNTLDLQANTQLVQLRCFGNQLTSLSLPSSTSLSMVRCQKNQIASLDVSANHTLSDLDCSSNQLASLNFQNGNNAKVGHFDARGNPNLVCIQVDNVALAQKNWKHKVDDGTSFSLSCPDASSFATKNSSNEIMVYPNPTSGKVQLSQEADQISVYDAMQGSLISVPTTTSEVDLSALKQGVYILKVFNRNSVQIFRVVKK